jgi:hypothetical protein
VAGGKLEEVYYLSFSNFFDFVFVQNSGGGEVSGGGTLYMKWGAGSLRYRECVMREQV